MRVRPTTLLQYEQCPRAYSYKYVLRLRNVVEKVNLVFGTTVHKTVTDWLITLAMGSDVATPDALENLFLEAWNAKTHAIALEYSTLMGPEMVPKVGARLVHQFASRWPDWDLDVVFDDQGKPVIEQRLEADLGGGLVLSTAPDVLTMDREGLIMPLDFKTAASPCEPWFPEMSDQLTAQQLAIEANRDRLMIAQVDRIGFGELIKKAVSQKETGANGGPQVLAPKTAPRRSTRQLREYVNKVHDLAEDIAAERFPARPGSAFNSPCKMCDFLGYCKDGDMTGLTEAPRDASGTAIAA